MANIVKLKRSSVVGKVPDAGNIEVGEPAVNLVDRILYTKDTGGNVIVIGSGTTSNVIEGSNLYFTNARAIGAFSEGSGIVIDSNGLISANITFTSSVVSVNGQTGTVVLSTANIAENSNLYYTDARVYSNVISIGYATNANVALKANVADLNTSNVSEGSNLYYTDARAYSNVNSIGYALNANLTTANVSEVTNLYFTNTRSRQSLSAGTGVIYDSSNGIISIGQAVGTTSDVEFHDIIISGNLTVTGTATTINARELSISDNMIYLNEAIAEDISNVVGDGANVTYTISDGHGHVPGEVVRVTGVNPSTFNQLSYVPIIAVTSNTIVIANTTVDTYISGGNLFVKAAVNPDLGFSGGYNDGTYHHAGLFRDATDGIWKFFENYGPEPDSNVYIDTSHVTFRLANVAANEFIGNITSLQNHTTSNLSEGTNLYFTNARSYANTLVAIKTGNGIIYDSTTGNITLSPSGVTASTYGGAAVQPVIVVDEFGRITSVSNVTSTVANTNITGNIISSQITSIANSQITGNIISSQITSVANTQISGNIISSQITSVANSQITGNTISSKLEPTGVTASTYGGAAVQPVIVIDQQGRITSASNVTSTVANTNITGNIISSQITSVANNQITGNIISSQITSVANSQITGNIISSQITSVANTQITGNTISSKLEPTGVTASTYGGAAVQPVIVIDQQGRITSASNVTSTVANTNITGNIISSQITSVANTQISGNIISSQITSVANSQITGNTISSKLEPTGVTAGVYGNATIIPVITVDQQGRITNVSNASVTGVSSGTSNAVSNTQIIAADGTSTNYNLADYPSTSNTLIFVDGLLQYSPVHYSFSSNTISFVTAPSNGEQIYIVTLAPGTGGGGSSTSTVDPTSIKRINYGLNILLGR